MRVLQKKGLGVRNMPCITKNQMGFMANKFTIEANFFLTSTSNEKFKEKQKI